MKKLLTILLAALLAMAMTVSAFAEEGNTPPEEINEQPEGPTADAPQTTGPSATHEDITVPKKYTLNGEEQKGKALIPSEILSFTVTPNKTNPDSKAIIEVADLNTAEGLEITISFPDYTKMGVYSYIVSEDEGKTLGVTYDQTDIEVIVTVVNEKPGEGNVDELKVYVAVYKLTATGKRGDKIEGDDEEEITDPDGAAFTNDYSTGQLTVSKTVTGNLASNTKEFTIHVTFKNETELTQGNKISYSVAGVAQEPFTVGDEPVDVYLKHGDSAVFTNIPAGVTYTVVEDEKHTTGDKNGENGYTATYTNKDNDITTSGSGSIEAADEDTVAIQNEKKTEIETGIFLDSLPYVLVIGVVSAAVVLMNIRKRREMEG